MSIFASTSESSSIQTAELIMKYHAIFDKGSHDLSPHYFGSISARGVVIKRIGKIVFFIQTKKSDLVGQNWSIFGEILDGKKLQDSFGKQLYNF